MLEIAEQECRRVGPIVTEVPEARRRRIADAVQAFCAKLFNKALSWRHYDPILFA